MIGRILVRAVLLGVGVMTLMVPGPLAADGGKTALDFAQDLESSDAKVRREAAYQLSRPGVADKQVIPQLIKALEDPQQQVWFGAISALANLKEDAEPALPALLKELENWAPFQRGKDRQGSQSLYRTALALGSIGAPAVPALSNALGSEAWHVRAGAARALGFAGEAAAPVAPRLAVSLADDRPEVRDAAAETLAGLGEVALVPLEESLRNGADPKSRAFVAEALGRLGTTGGPAGPALREILFSESDTVLRTKALVAYSRVTPGSEALVSDLLRAWDDDDESVRRAAHSALLLVRPTESALLPAIVPHLDSPDAQVRDRAAIFLSELGPDAGPAAGAVARAIGKSVAAGAPDPALLRALASLGNPGVDIAFEALRKIPSSELKAEAWPMDVLRRVDLNSLAALRSALSDPSESVRAGSLEGLAALGVRARSAAKVLPPLMDDGDAAVRWRAWIAAGACGVAPEAMLVRLESGLDDASPEVRRAVVSGIAFLGKAARPAIPKLIEVLGSGDGALETAAIRALGALGADGEAAAPALVARASGSPPEIQVEILQALGSIGAVGDSDAQRLVSLGDAPDPAVRRAFLEAVVRFKEGGKVALPVVVRGLKDSDPAIRAAAVFARVAMDRESDEAVGVAVAGLKDSEGVVRRSAASALAQLEERGRPGEAFLFAMLADPDDRTAARDALRAIHPVSIPALMEALGHGDWAVREMAVDALARRGSEAQEAVPLLEKAAREDPSEEVKRASRRAVRRIRPS